MTPDTTSHAHTSKARVAAISILASGGMAAAKLVVGIIIGSLALISEALHSSIDLVATVITWLVVKVSDQPADAEHHYGHGKIESLSALGVTAMLYVLAGGILVTAYGHLREGATPPTLSAIPFIVLLLDIAVNLWRARALHRTAHATQSQALAADALHFASDVLGSVAVIIGLALSGLGYPWGDAAPEARRGNFDFRAWEPRSVDAHRDGDSAFGVRGLVGNGWEWTSTPFAPFEGFRAQPFYRGYSADFFDGRHYVMKGGSPLTAAPLLRRSFRNWFQPHYPYIYAGFRCVAN